MKKTKDNILTKEDLIIWRDELKKKEKQIDQEFQETIGQAKQFRDREEVLINRQKEAYAENQEELQLKELQKKEQKEKKRVCHVKIAVYLPLAFIGIGMVICFAVLNWSENSILNDYTNRMANLENDYQEDQRYVQVNLDYQWQYDYWENIYLDKKGELEDEITGLNALILSEAKNNQSDTVQSMLTLGENNKTEIREYIKGLPLRSTKTLETVYYRDNAYYVCREKYNLPFYGNVSSGTNTIYPGAMIKGDTLFSENYTVVPIKRGSMDLVCNIAGSNAVSVEEVTYENVLDALNTYQQLASEGGRYKEAQHNSTIVHSSTEINANFGIAVQADASRVSVNGNAAGNIGKSFKEDKTNLLVTVYQIAYTVSAQPPQNCEDFFAEGAEMSQLGIYEPAYISSVDYGRIILIMISSEKTEEELKADVDLAVEYNQKAVSGISVDAEVQASYDKIMKEDSSDCTITVIGGNAEASEFSDMNISNCMEKLSTLLAEGEQNGVVNPVPISYTMNYIHNNDVVPCVQITKEMMLPKENVRIIKLQWENNVTQKGTVRYEIDSVGNDTMVLYPNFLSIKNGQTIENAVYVITQEETPQITINKVENKKKLFGGMKTVQSTKTIELNDEKTLEKYDISAIEIDDLNNME